MSEDFITPPTTYPFQPGEAVYWLPSNHRMMSPAPRIRGVVLTAGGYSAYIQREDGSRAAVNTSNLAYAAYCSHCYAPAVMTMRGRLVCPGCGGPVIEPPPPDEMVLLRFPLDSFGWHTSMSMRRAIVKNGKSTDKKLSNGTIAIAFRRLRRALAIARRHKLIGENPAADARARRRHRSCS
jgi:hypothetical protein